MARATAIHSRLKLRYLHIFFVHRISHISSRVTYNPLSWRSLIKKKEEKENTCNEYIRSISNSSLHRRRSRFRLGPRVSKLARTPGDKKTIKRNALNRRECGAIVRPGPTRLASFRKLFHGGRNRGSTSSRAPTLKNEHRDSRTDWLVRKKTKRASLLSVAENVTRFLLFLRSRTCLLALGFFGCSSLKGKRADEPTKRASVRERGEESGYGGERV